MKLSDFKVLTFDCYGTLIDWETGLLAALEGWRRRTAVAAGGDDLLAAFAEAESKVQSESPAMRYPDVLAEVLRRLGKRFGKPATEEEARAFGASIGDWPAFPDTADALRHLKRHYKLVILSNVDRASFARSNPKLGVAFDAVYTAEDIGSYKPDRRNFEYLIQNIRLAFGLDKARILHVAQSLFHDHVPAKELGLATCWIDRRGGRKGSGATAPVDGGVATDFRFQSLGMLADVHRAFIGRPR
ncbi:MAG: haloacid dehalogenase type II [Rhodospirillales bacterium]|nr:haloacid dehalogenase type II [Rhodospirillales bacterium]